MDQEKFKPGFKRAALKDACTPLTCSMKQPVLYKGLSSSAKLDKSKPISPLKKKLSSSISTQPQRVRPLGGPKKEGMSTAKPKLVPNLTRLPKEENLTTPSLKKNAPQKTPVKLDKNQLNCNICGKVSSSPAILKCHIKTHKGYTPVPLDLAEATSNARPLLECNKCKAKFDTHLKLFRHNVVVHSEDPKIPKGTLGKENKAKLTGPLVVPIGKHGGIPANPKHSAIFLKTMSNINSNF